MNLSRLACTMDECQSVLFNQCSEYSKNLRIIRPVFVCWDHDKEDCLYHSRPLFYCHYHAVIEWSDLLQHCSCQIADAGLQTMLNDILYFDLVLLADL